MGEAAVVDHDAHGAFVELAVGVEQLPGDVEADLLGAGGIDPRPVERVGPVRGLAQGAVGDGVGLLEHVEVHGGAVAGALRGGDGQELQGGLVADQQLAGVGFDGQQVGGHVARGRAGRVDADEVVGWLARSCGPAVEDGAAPATEEGGQLLVGGRGHDDLVTHDVGGGAVVGLEASDRAGRVTVGEARDGRPMGCDDCVDGHGEVRRAG